MATTTKPVQQTNTPVAPVKPTSVPSTARTITQDQYNTILNSWKAASAVQSEMKRLWITIAWAQPQVNPTTPTQTAPSIWTIGWAYSAVKDPITGKVTEKTTAPVWAPYTWNTKIGTAYSAVRSPDGTVSSNLWGWTDIAGNVSNTKPETITPKVEAIKPEVDQKYLDTTPERLSEIINNLNATAWTSPSMFKDLNTFKQNFSYDKRAPEQQKALADRYTWYQKVQSFQNMNAKDIASGKIAVNMEDLSKYSPTLYNQVVAEKAKKTALDKINAWINNKIEDPEVVEDTPVENTIMDNVKKMFWEPQTYDLVARTKEIKEQYGLADLQTEVTAKKAEVTRIKNLMNNKLEEVRKRYEWTWATEWFIRAMASKENTYLQNELDWAMADYTQSADNMNNAITNINDELWTEMKQYELNSQSIKDRMSQLGFYYQYTPQGQAEQAQMKYELEYPDMNTGTVSQQKYALNQALTDYYKDYGMIIKRPQAQVVSDVLAYAKTNGISTSQALQENFIKPLQNKPEYTMIKNKALGVETPKQPSWTYDYDPETWKYTVKMSGEWALPTNIQADMDRKSIVNAYSSALGWVTSLNQLGSTVSSIFQDWTYWGQCWFAVNNVSKAIGSDVHFWNSLEEKINPAWTYTKSKSPIVWSYVVMDSPTQPWSWHVWIVTSINNDGTFNMKSSNYNWSEQWRTDENINPNSKAIRTFIVPDAKSLWTKQNLTSDQQKQVDKVITDFENEPIVKEFNTINTQVKYLNSIPNNTQNPWDDMALIYWFAKIMDPNSVVREWEYATAKKYAQSLWEQYAKEIDQAVNWKWFLSQNARTKLKETITNKLAVNTQFVSWLMDQKAKQMEKYGVKNGRQYLTNYLDLWSEFSQATVDPREELKKKYWATTEDTSWYWLSPETYKPNPYWINLSNYLKQ